jgi:hypothetical protein
VPDRCRITIDRRFLIEEDIAEVKAEITALMERCGRATRLRLRDPRPVRGAAHHDRPRRAGGAHRPGRDRGVLDRQAEFVVSPGTYDQKHIDRIGRLKNCIAYGPGILDLAHQPDEWVGIDDMVDSAKVMALTLRELLPDGARRPRVFDEAQVPQRAGGKLAGRRVAAHQVIVELAHQRAEAAAAGLLPNEGRHTVRRNRKDILRFDPIHAMPPCRLSNGSGARDTAPRGQADRRRSNPRRHNGPIRALREDSVTASRQTAHELVRRCHLQCTGRPDGPWRPETIVSTTETRFSGDFFGGTGQYAGKRADGEKRTMGTRILATGAGLLIQTSALALILGTGAALAQQTDITIGMVLEPPNLDPTAGPRPPSTRSSTPTSSRG